MRRKSERTKEKEKSSPDKKSEKPTRRSRRHSRRSMRSVSASPERTESGPEENESATLRSSQEDTEEEHAVSVEEPSSQVGAVITADSNSIAEVEADNQTISSRTRKSKKQSVETISQGENPVAKTDVSQDGEWKEDNTFWQEEGSKMEGEDTKHRDKGSRSPVWKVKCSDGGGGEIHKLKLCIVRPQETTEPCVKKKKRLSRTSNQMKEKSDGDDNDSSKGSLGGEEDRMSSDEKPTASKSENEQEKEEEVVEEEEKEVQEPENTKTFVEETSQDSQITQSEIIRNSDDESKEKVDEEEVKVESTCKGEVTEVESKDVGSGNEEEDSRKNDVEESTNNENNENNESNENSENTLANEEAKPDVNTISCSPVSPKAEVESADTGNVVSEVDTDCVQVDSGLISEDSAHPVDEIQNTSPPSPKEVSNCTSPSIVEKDSPLSNQGDECEVSNENKPTDNAQEISVSSDVVHSPKDCSNSSKNISEPNVEVHEKSASSEEEKEVESTNSSPRFKHRSEGEIAVKETSPDEYKPHNSSNVDSGKHSRHLERRNRSPRRKEKISLRRSFSSKSVESEDKSIEESLDKREIADDHSEEQSVQDKENEPQRLITGPDSCKGSGNVARKRRWGQSNSSRPSKKPVLSISTDSLKTLIPGAKLVPIGEVQLVQEEEVKKEKEDWDYEKDLEREKPSTEIVENTAPEKKATVILTDAPRISVAVTDDHESKVITRKISIVSDDARTLQKSPSPPRHRTTNILYITNLVRPFTVNQLRELLARTGKIVDGGFWIDKIKSKCYVEYENEIEAKETRHALHGVRWPVSNPKTLCVDFGRKEDMEMAQAVAESDLIPRKTEPLKVERNLDGWGVEPAREKELEKNVRDHEREKERDYDRDRVRGKDRTYHAPMELVDHHKKVAVREWDLGKLGQLSPERDTHYEEKIKEKEKKIRKEKPRHSRSISPHDNPGRKIKKKEEDAPAKLLDDLFRKTKTTPCIYWLPLTAEQIVVKEEMRRKHMAEHERRMAEMRKAERERERVRAQQRQHRRVNEREKRRRRSGSASPKK